MHVASTSFAPVSQVLVLSHAAEVSKDRPILPKVERTQYRMNSTKALYQPAPGRTCGCIACAGGHMRGQLCCNKSQPQVERTQYRISSTKLGTPLYTARAFPGSVTDKDAARIPASTRANLWVRRMCRSR